MNSQLPLVAQSDENIALWVRRTKSTAQWLLLSLTGFILGICLVVTVGGSIIWAIVGSLLTILSFISFVVAAEQACSLVRIWRSSDE